MAGRSENKKSLLEQLLRWSGRLVARQPKLVLWLVLVLTCGAAGYAVCFIGFHNHRSDLIDPDAAFHQRWIEYTEDFGDETDMVVVVEAVSTGTIKDIIDGLAEKIEREPELFGEPLFRIDTSGMRKKALQYMSTSELSQVRRTVNSYKKIWEDNRWNEVRLESFIPQLTAQIDRQARRDLNTDRYVRRAHQLTSSMDKFLDDQGVFLSPWPDPLSTDSQLKQLSDDYAYFLNENGTMGFLKVKPVHQEKEFNGVSNSILRLRELITDSRKTYSKDKSVSIGLTGIPVLENDEMARSQADMLRATGVSFVAVGLLLFVGFRGIRHPMLALLMVIVGVAWTFGVTTAWIGHLNILSVSFTVILVGLGIDFGIHFLSRYLQLRHDGHLLRPALEETSGSVGTGIVTAAVTTALAFFAAAVSDFLGIAELGKIAGVGILLCALATFVVLPALICLADQHIPAEKLPTPMQGRILRSLVNGTPIVLLVASLIVVGGLASQAFRYKNGEIYSKIKYDSNLLNLQADGLESVAVQNRIFDDSHSSLLHAVAMADSMQEAVELRARFEALPTVDRVEDLASKVPPKPAGDSARLISALASDLRTVPRQAPVYDDSNPSMVGRELEKLYNRLRQEDSPLAIITARGLNDFLDEFEQLPPRHQIAFLTAYQNQMARSLVNQYQVMADSTGQDRVVARDLPDELKARFLSADGRWLLQIFPKEQVWEEEPLERFVADLRTVDANVTGTPIQNYESSKQIFDSYKTTALYALAVISLVLLLDFLSPGQKLLTIVPPIAIVGFIGYTLYQRTGEIKPAMLVGMYMIMVAFIGAVLDFRNVRDTVFALLTPVFGLLMTFGALALIKVDLNPANLIVLPLVLGIGVDDGVHVIHDFRRQRGHEYNVSPSVINAIVLTSLTSIIGFGSLMVASHRGLHSIGLVLAIGVACCLFVSLVMLPSILTLVGVRQAQIDERIAASREEQEMEAELRRIEREEKKRSKAAAKSAPAAAAAESGEAAAQQPVSRKRRNRAA